MKSVNSDNDFVCYGALRIAICDILYLGCRKYYKNMSLAKNFAKYTVVHKKILLSLVVRRCPALLVGVMQKSYCLFCSCHFLVD